MNGEKADPVNLSACDTSPNPMEARAAHTFDVVRAWKAGDACRLDGVAAEIIAIRGIWAWVAKDKRPDDPETVALILLDRFGAAEGR